MATMTKECFAWACDGGGKRDCFAYARNDRSGIDLLRLLMTKKRDCPNGITFVTTAYACPEGPMDSLCDSFGGSLKAFGYWGFKPSEGLV